MDRGNRKALVRAHDKPRPMDVDRNRSHRGAPFVIDSSTTVESAPNGHRAQLDAVPHFNVALQGAWNSVGAKGFEFGVLDLLEPREDPGYDPTEDLDALEAVWRERIG
jgi:hypothetical protein